MVFDPSVRQQSSLTHAFRSLKSDKRVLALFEKYNREKRSAGRQTVELKRLRQGSLHFALSESEHSQLRDFLFPTVF